MAHPNMNNPDRGWKPNGRPQSTLAQNFSAALDDLFKIDGGLDDLSKHVHQRKQTVTIQSEELQALEARLRETEERLKRAKTSPPSSDRKNSQRRTPAPESGSPLAYRSQRNTRLDTNSVKGNEMPDRPPSARSENQHDN